jgi:NarL family two-component system sensor histidine kinase LiaS
MPKSNKESAKQSQANDAAATAAALEERRRISRELHDRVLQLLSSVRLRAEVCRRELISQPEELDKELQTIERATDGAIAEIRRLLADSAAQTDLTAGTLERRLREEMEIFRARSGIKLDFHCTIRADSLPESVERELYFSLREGIINAIRHSRASELKLSLIEDGPVCRATLTDNGTGFELSATEGGSHYGLRIIKERIETVGGSLAIVTAPGQGTRISIEVPSGKETL